MGLALLSPIVTPSYSELAPGQGEDKQIELPSDDDLGVIDGAPEMTEIEIDLNLSLSDCRCGHMCVQKWVLEDPGTQNGWLQTILK